MSPGYDVRARRGWQPVDDVMAAVVAVAAVLAVWRGPAAGLAVAALSAVVWRRLDVAALAVAIAVLGGWLGDRAWRDVQPDALGPYTGWVQVVGDPAPIGSGTQVVVAVDGERFRAAVFGPLGYRVKAWSDGEWVQVDGERRLVRPRGAGAARARHIVGEFRLERVGDRWPGPPVREGANRVRLVLRRGAERTMSPPGAALFTGLVIGDDSRQERAMVDDFRAAGLSHLTAVSGQNVAYVVALASVGLRRLPRWWRLAATLAVVGWFVLLTRAEPSVVRAGAMAAWSAVAFAAGSPVGPRRVLLLGVTTLVLIDPLLVWSVGFWLSVGATAGVCVVGPLLAERLAGPAWLTAPLAVTLGAQVGVLVPSLLVFGRLPAVGVVANLLAVPVAGVVMLHGIPAAVLAAVLPGPLAWVVMLPSTIGTWWVSTVASTAARLEPHGLAALGIWGLQAMVLAGLLRARWRARESSVRR